MVAIIITMVVFYTPQLQVIAFSVILVISKALLVLPQFLLVHLISLPVIVLLCTDFLLICFEFIAVCSHSTLYFSFYYILKIFIVGVYIYHMFIFSDKCKLQERRHLEGYVLLCIITCVEHNACSTVGTQQIFIHLNYISLSLSLLCTLCIPGLALSWGVFVAIPPLRLLRLFLSSLCAIIASLCSAILINP